jgi:hypothetical protein
MPGLVPGIFLAADASDYGTTAARNFNQFETLKLTI